MDMQYRRYNWRPSFPVNISEPVGGNYYPTDTITFLRDPSQNLQLTVITDRAHGSSAQGNGLLELGMHRRLLYVLRFRPAIRRNTHRNG
jgi:hypothetical protein